MPNNRQIRLYHYRIVLILTIILIITALVAPRFGQDIGRIKMNNAAMKIATDIRFAQNKATTTQQRHRINFNSSTTYDIQFCNGIYNIATCTCPAWVLATDPKQKTGTVSLFSSLQARLISGMNSNYAGVNSAKRNRHWQCRL